MPSKLSATHELTASDGAASILPETVVHESRPDDRGGSLSAPAIERGRSVEMKWWRVGGDRVEMAPTQDGFSTRVSRADWGPDSLDLGGIFAEEVEATAWCERMAIALAEDALDDAEGGV